MSEKPSKTNTYCIVNEIFIGLLSYLDCVE